MNTNLQSANYKLFFNLKILPQPRIKNLKCKLCNKNINNVGKGRIWPGEFLMQQQSWAIIHYL